MSLQQRPEIPVVKQATNENEQINFSIPVHVSLSSTVIPIKQCESTHIFKTIDGSCANYNSEKKSANGNLCDLKSKNQISVDEVYQTDEDLNSNLNSNANLLGKKFSLAPDSEVNMTVDEIYQINPNFIPDAGSTDDFLSQKSNLSYDTINVSHPNDSNKINLPDKVYETGQDLICDYNLNYASQEKMLDSAKNAFSNNETQDLPVNSNSSSVNPEVTSTLCSSCSEHETPLNISSDELSEKHFQCNFCNKKFSNKQNCDRHYRTHTNDKPYECKICGRRFPFQRSRDRHYRTHTNVKAYECNMCKKRFSRNQGLKSHILTHTKEKPHQCEICSKCFPRIGSLRQHYRLHTKERPYDCETCGKSFSLKRNRDKHFRVVHMNEKPFQCKECSKKFSSPKTLQCHFTTHTNEKPYLCDVCNKRYSHKASLTLHCKQHLSCKDINIPDILKQL